MAICWDWGLSGIAADNIFTIFGEGTYNFNQMKALVVAISEYIAKYRYQLFSTDTACCCSGPASLLIIAMCAAEERSEYLQESWHRRPASRAAAQPRPVSKTWFGCDRTQPQLSRQPDTAQLPRFIWCAVFDVSCCVLLFGVLSDVLSVLSDVWRSGRCLHPPRQGGGCVCLDISAGQSAGHCWSPCLSRPHLACHLENGSGLLKMAPDLPQLWRGRAGPGPVRPRPVSSGVMILINVIQTMNTKWPAVRTRRPLCPL